MRAISENYSFCPSSFTASRERRIDTSSDHSSGSDTREWSRSLWCTERDDVGCELCIAGAVEQVEYDHLAGDGHGASDVRLQFREGPQQQMIVAHDQLIVPCRIHVRVVSWPAEVW